MKLITGPYAAQIEQTLNQLRDDIAPHVRQLSSAFRDADDLHPCLVGMLVAHGVPYEQAVSTADEISSFGMFILRKALENAEKEGA